MHEVDTDHRIASYLEHGERAVDFVVRRRHLTADEADEFRSTVRVKLLENDHAILRKFGGRSSLPTYLVVVVQRLFLDFRTSAWGKWRPSAEAKRLGPTAVLLERLTSRDGLTFDEAYATLRCIPTVTESEEELFALSERLPRRPSRRFVDDSSLEGTLVSQEDVDPIAQAEHLAVAAKSNAALTEALAELPVQDRLILKLRYDDGLKVSEIASMMRLEQKPLYRRIEQLLRNLRTAIENRGVRKEEVVGWLAGPLPDVPVEVSRQAGIAEERPSL